MSGALAPSAWQACRRAADLAEVLAVLRRHRLARRLAGAATRHVAAPEQASRRWRRGRSSASPALDMVSGISAPAALTTSERLRRNPVVRHAPVTALLILIAVCFTGLGVILLQPMALLTVAPLGAVVVLYFRQVSSGREPCIGRSSPTRS